MIKNILLAEDERGTALLVKTQLEKCGYTVHVAGNGLEALNLIQGSPFDLVITDVVMPEMDGVDLYIELKKNPDTANIPIIIITDKQVFRESFLALGVDHFVAKADDISALIEKVRTVEAGLKEAKNYHKILIGGTKANTLAQMRDLLYDRSCLVATAENSRDILSQAFLMVPHIIIIDIFLHDAVTAQELIRSLHCYDFLKKTRILVYTSFMPGDFGASRNILENIEGQIKNCIDAGAVKYIGRFNPAVFLEQMGEYIS